MTKDRAINYLCRTNNNQHLQQMDFERSYMEYNTLIQHGLDREAKALAITLFSHAENHEHRERAREMMESITLSESIK